MIDFIVGKAQLVSFNFLSEKLTVRMLGLSFSSKLDQALNIVSFNKSGFKKS